LFEGVRLFHAVRDGLLNDEQHLAEMVALMGPPPPAFLQRSEKCKQFWDSEGTISTDLMCRNRQAKIGNWEVDLRNTDSKDILRVPRNAT
jgi:hypothetical protein